MIGNQDPNPSRRTGQSGVWQQPYESGQTEAGAYARVPYEATDKTQIDALEAYCIGFRIQYSRRDSHGKSRIEMFFPYNFNVDPATEPPISLWEISSQKVEKDLLESALSFGTIGAISAPDAILIQTALQQQQQGIPIKSTWFNSPTDTTGAALTYQDANHTPYAAAANPAGCYSVFLLMLHGVRSYPVKAPVLKHTLTTNSAYPIKASLANTQQILSTATLILNESIPNNLLFNLPSDATPAFFVETAGDLQYGWFKAFPTVRQIAQLKWNIEQEWQYGLWPIKLYGAPL